MKVTPANQVNTYQVAYTWSLSCRYEGPEMADSVDIQTHSKPDIPRGFSPQLRQITLVEVDIKI